MDITKFMDKFIDMFVEVFLDLYDILSNIKFWGVSLFEFIMSVFLVGTVFTLLISVARNGANKVSRVVKNAEHNRTGQKGDNS